MIPYEEKMSKMIKQVDGLNCKMLVISGNGRPFHEGQLLYTNGSKFFSVGYDTFSLVSVHSLKVVNKTVYLYIK